MAHALTITYGSTTITLIDTDHGILEYTPRESDEPTVAETAKFLFDEHTIAALAAGKRALSLAAEAIKRRQQQGAGDRVYLNFWPDGYAASTTSELFDLRIDLPDEILGIDWAIKQYEPGVFWTRESGFDDPEIELPLSNAAGSAAAGSGGLVVYQPRVYLQGTTISFDNATKEIRDSANGMALFKTGDTITVRGSVANNNTFTVVTGNVAAKVVVAEAVTTGAAGPSVTVFGPAADYIEVAAADVTGDLPGKIRLELENRYNDGAVFNNILWVAHNVDHTGLNHLLEAENATGPGSNTNAATSSNGAHRSGPMTGTTETTLYTLALSTALLDLMLGFPFALFAAFVADPATTVKARYKLLDGTIVLAAGEQVTLDGTEIAELGTTRIHPQLEGQTAIEPISLVLTGQNSASGGSVSLDVVKLLPLGGAGIRKYTPKSGAFWKYQEKIVDDEFNKALYLLTTTATKTRRYEADGNPIRLIPNKKQRLHFTWTNSTGDWQVARTIRARLYFRARRRTL